MVEYRQDFMFEDIDNLMLKAFEKVQKERESKITGYYDLPKESQKLVKEVELEDREDFDTIVVIGIGGSSLGTKAIYSLLKHKNENYKKIIFLENPDPLELTNKFKAIDKEKSIFIVVSKSGTTIETISIFKALIRYFDIDFKKDRVYAITDKDSPLHNFAKLNGIKSYEIPKNVGGRFSVLSSVGIVPLTLAGFDTLSILKGAALILNRFFEKKEEHLLKKAAFIASNWKKYRMNVLFSYSTYLEDFTKWYVQLWGESLGKIDKNGQRVGLTPIGHIGSVDQHSFLQLLMEGPKDKSVTFLKIEDFENSLKIPDISLKYLEKTNFINSHSFNELLNAECDATKESLVKVGVPVDLISLDRLDEENIGEMILYFELLTSLVGVLLDVDTYNQPGVELGKKILYKKYQKE